MYVVVVLLLLLVVVVFLVLFYYYFIIERVRTCMYVVSVMSSPCELYLTDSHM